MSKEHLDLDVATCEKIQKLRDGGANWGEIGEQVGMTPGRAIFHYEFITCPKKDKVKGSYEERKAAVVGLRDQGLSWGKIAIRVDMPEPSVKAAYADATGSTTRGLRLEGKGGRYPEGEGPEPKAKVAKVKPAAGTVKTTGKKLVDMNLEELKVRLERAKIKVATESGTRTIDVATVKSLKNGTINGTNSSNGGSFAVKVADIKGASNPAPARPAKEKAAKAAPAKESVKKAAPAKKAADAGAVRRPGKKVSAAA